MTSSRGGVGGSAGTTTPTRVGRPLSENGTAGSARSRAASPRREPGDPRRSADNLGGDSGWRVAAITRDSRGSGRARSSSAVGGSCLAGLGIGLLQKQVLFDRAIHARAELLVDRGEMIRQGRTTVEVGDAGERPAAGPADRLRRDEGTAAGSWGAG